MGLHEACSYWSVHLSLTLAMQLHGQRERHAHSPHVLMRPMLHLYSKNGCGAHRTGLPKVSCCDKLADSRGAGCNNSAISL